MILLPGKKLSIYEFTSYLEKCKSNQASQWAGFAELSEIIRSKLHILLQTQMQLWQKMICNSLPECKTEMDNDCFKCLDTVSHG